MEDSAIVERFLKRDESAVDLTAQKYGLSLRKIACRILEDMASAEECENDTYLEAWNRIPPNEPRTYLFAFLGRITRHLAIDICRKNASQKRHAVFCELTQEMAECIGEDHVENAINAEALHQLLNNFLSKHSRMQCNVFVRRYWYFDSIADISKRYGYSQSKVKTMLFRLRKELQEVLKREGYTI